MSAGAEPARQHPPPAPQRHLVAGVPYSWQDKRTLRQIREGCPEPASGLGVYVALTVAASDSGADEFHTTLNWLACLSGFSKRTVQARLGDLERLGVVSISTPACKAPGTYRLLAYGNGCLTCGNGEAPPLPRSERNEGKEGDAKPRRPLTTAERIGLERRLQILKERFQTLQDQTAELWQRDQYPELVAEKQALKLEIEQAEDGLLA